MLCDNPRVSIVSMVYNNFDGLLLSVKSALDQNYNNMEIIIADDCSKDFSRENLLKYVNEICPQNDKEISIFVNDENIGTVKNFNNAIRKTNGDIIIQLNAGDVLCDSNTVSCIIEKMIEKSSMVLATSRLLIDKDTRKIIRKIPDEEEINHIVRLNTPEKQNRAIFTGDFFNMASGAAIAYRKDFLNKVGGFDEEYLLWEDGPFFEKITSNGYKIDYCYDIISVFYETGGVSNSQISDKMKKDVITFLKKGLAKKEFSVFTKKKIKYRLKLIMYSPKKFVDISLMDVYIYKKILRLKRAIYLITKQRKN